MNTNSISCRSGLAMCFGRACARLWAASVPRVLRIAVAAAYVAQQGGCAVPASQLWVSRLCPQVGLRLIGRRQQRAHAASRWAVDVAFVLRFRKLTRRVRGRERDGSDDQRTPVTHGDEPPNVQKLSSLQPDLVPRPSASTICGHSELGSSALAAMTVAVGVAVGSAVGLVASSAAGALVLFHRCAVAQPLHPGHGRPVAAHSRVALPPPGKEAKGGAVHSVVGTVGAITSPAASLHRQLQQLPRSSADVLSAVEWQALMSGYDDEPDIAEVIAAARAHADPLRAEFASLAQRSRLRGLLPRLTASLRHGQAYDLTDTQVAAGTRYRVGSDRDLSVQLELLFDLPSLLASREEQGLLRQQRIVGQTRETVLPRIVKLYFERRRLQILRDLGVRADVAAQIRIVEVEALLDSFTGGAFSSMIQQMRNR